MAGPGRLRAAVAAWRAQRRDDAPARRNRARASHCFYCGVAFAETGARQRTVDHRLPRSRAGSDRLVNLVFACRACNQRKADLQEAEFLSSAWLARRRSHRTRRTRGGPMEIHALLAELFGRIPDHVRAAVDGLDAEALATAPAASANPIGWLVWHLTRVQDHHVSELLDEEQLWVTGEWAPRFGVAADPRDTGYGHTPEDVAAIRPDGPDVLVDYHTAVAERTGRFLEQLTPGDLDRVVDERWDPPVTLGVRLVSIADDDIQHAGQAAYVRGLLERR